MVTVLPTILDMSTSYKVCKKFIDPGLLIMVAAFNAKILRAKAYIYIYKAYIYKAYIYKAYIYIYES